MEKQLEKLYQDQIKNEWYSGYLYMSMAAHFEAMGLGGFANWMKKQAGEEYKHGQRIWEFLNDRGVKVLLQAIPQPPTDFASPLQIFEMTLDHEKQVTAMINAIADQSDKVKDRPSMVFIQWFITEQVEEEKSASDVLEALKRAKTDSSGASHLDRQLGQRE